MYFHLNLTFVFSFVAHKVLFDEKLSKHLKLNLITKFFGHLMPGPKMYKGDFSRLSPRLINNFTGLTPSFNLSPT